MKSAEVLKPKKALGQHFLYDRRVLQKIIDAAKIQPSDTVLEVGPGQGILTVELAARAKRVIAIEKDTQLIPILNEKLAAFSNAELINKDILSYQLPATSYKLVANIPYYITSPILNHFIKDQFPHGNPPAYCVLLVQKEVAQKLCAKPPRMNVLALHVQTFGNPKIISYVSKNAFSPQPKVDSAIITIDILTQPAVSCDLKRYFNLIHTGFSQKRKTLSNSLKTLGGAELLEKAGIDPKRRAETLTPHEWERLAELYL